MRYYYPLFLLLLLTACQEKPAPEEQRFRPAPTTGTIVNYGEEEAGRGNARREWEEKLHRAAPDVNWRAVEYQNSMNLHRINTQLRSQGMARSGQISIAGGQVEGTWKERGAADVAGSVHDLAYDSEADVMYTVSDGGSMWSVAIEDQEWTLINQELRFNRGLLELTTNPDGNQRIVALVAQTPHYSDDGGASWTASDMIDIDINPRWGGTRRSFTANDGKIYMLTKEGYSSKYKLLVSDDQGASFQLLRSPSETETLEDIRQPNHSDQVLLLTSNDTVLETSLVLANDTIVALNSSPIEGLPDNPKLLAAVLPDSSLKLMIYGNDDIHKSLDTGRTWSLVRDLPSRPWRVGIHMSKANPDYLILGNVNLEYSEDGGESWDRGASWADYYDNVAFKLHADMMYFEDFQRPDGTYRTFVSCHGGLSMSTDSPTEYLNLSLGGLRNAQYYSTATKRGTEDVIYAGSQDQGLQFQTTSNDGLEGFEQVISGDYGNLSYSHTGERLYSMYPRGGLLTWNTEWDQYVDWTDTPGENGFVWITPFMVVPDDQAPKGEVIYIAGGHANGLEGSYLIKAEDSSTSDFNASYSLTNKSINFLDGGGGQITAVGYSPLDNNRLYIGTEEGRFYHTDDAGENWEPTINFLPEGFYLYGQAILASALDSNRVWFGGSGYSNPAVYQSNDGGENFQSMNEGLPPTVVMRMAANNDESLIFAATEAGPYVYVVAEGSWYYLGGMDAPAGRYYSVEYLPNSNIARFSSYNRGVWDFELDVDVSTRELANKLPDWSVFPNPTNGPLSIDKLPEGTQNIQLRDLTGKLILESPAPDLSTQATGVYLLTPVNQAGQATAKTKRVIVQ